MRELRRLGYKSILAFLLSVALPIVLGAQKIDWRDIRTGSIIPDEVYSDQPYIVKTDDGAWLCILTTGAGIEGESGQYIAVTRSFDRGKTWSKLLPLESPNGPEASYATLLKVPSGRIYAFYNHNSDNLREIKTNSGGVIKRVDSQGYFVFKFSDDHGISWSDKRYIIPVREFEIDRNNIYKGTIRFFWNVGRAFSHQNEGYVPLIKIGGFGDGFFTSNEGVLLNSDNIMKEADPEKIRWQTFPDGDIGLRSPKGGGPISAEQSYSVLSDGSFFVVYRSIDGHPVYSYSRDRGHTWDTPKYMSFADGRLMKHPRAANFAWRCDNGKFLYWFHNHGGRLLRDNPDIRRVGYLDRNPAWVCGGLEVDSPNGKIIKWSQPEILLYDDDPIIRMSYPDLVEDNGNYYVTETQKDIARIHKIDDHLLISLWGQFSNTKRAESGLIREWKFENTKFPTRTDSVMLKPFYVRNNEKQDHGGVKILSGFSIDINFTLSNLKPGQVLLDTRSETGKGILLLIAEDKTIRIELADGRTVSSWISDGNSLTEKKNHHVSIIVDGGPRIIMILIDGILQDGGNTRQFGWGRFNPFLQDVNGNDTWIIGKNINGKIHSLNFYNRALQVSEAIGNYKFYSSK